MGIDLEEPLRLRWKLGKPAPPTQPAKPRRKISQNALLGIGLWFLLWLGYNTGPWVWQDPSFPSSTTQLIHGVRAFFPMLAGWIALLVILARINRLGYWIMGPLGMMLFYAIVGLVSSVTLSPGWVEAVYFGVNYLAIVLVLFAIVMVSDPLPDLHYVLKFTWAIGILITLGLLGAIPFLGSQVIIPTSASPVGMRAYTGAGEMLGMAATRNTGFARYAAVSALVAFPGLMTKSRLLLRAMWAILFIASVYSLIIANGRTEIVAFVISMIMMLGTERAKRTVYFLVGMGAAILMGLRGFFPEFFLYFTRTGHVDLTMTGRTEIWEGGLKLLWTSPWVGYGFQADRFFLNQHMHDAFLHTLVQSGFLGGVPILIGLAITWYYLLYHFFIHQPADRSLIPTAILPVFLFITISSVSESTFAYYSAAWLLSAPIVAYVVALHRHLREASAKELHARALRARLARRKPTVWESHPAATPPTPAGGPSD